MRPRPDAAENVARAATDRNLKRASMRPRPDAAENVSPMLADERCYLASMRPRPDAAENTTFGAFVIASSPLQ